MADVVDVSPVKRRIRIFSPVAEVAACRYGTKNRFCHKDIKQQSLHRAFVDGACGACVPLLLIRASASELGISMECLHVQSPELFVQTRGDSETRPRRRVEMTDQQTYSIRHVCVTRPCFPDALLWIRCVHNSRGARLLQDSLRLLYMHECKVLADELTPEVPFIECWVFLFSM